MESAIKKTWYKSFIPPEPIRTSCLPPTTKRAWKSFLFTRLPILSWIWSYQTSYLVGDVVSGITVAIMHIPQGEHTLLVTAASYHCINRTGIWSIGRSSCCVWAVRLLRACYSIFHIWYFKTFICWYVSLKNAICNLTHYIGFSATCVYLIQLTLSICDIIHHVTRYICCN